MCTLLACGASVLVKGCHLVCLKGWYPLLKINAGLKKKLNSSWIDRKKGKFVGHDPNKVTVAESSVCSDEEVNRQSYVHRSNILF